MKKQTFERNMKKPTFKYDICSSAYASKIRLSRHRKSVHGNENSNFECNDCKRTFSIKQNLIKHIWNIHLKKKKILNSSIRPFECDICGADYTSNVFLSRHKKAVHENSNFQCNDCQRTFNRRHNLIRHLQSCPLQKRTINSAVTVYKCDVCGANYSSRQVLLKHRRAIHEDSNFQCNECMRSFNRRHNLVRHLHSCGLKKKSVNFPIQPCKREICDEDYPSKQNPSRHRRAIFKCSKFECNDCKRSFKKIRTLLRHVQNFHIKEKSSVHSRDRLYKCNLCESKFTFKHAMLRHKRSVHEKVKLDCEGKFEINAKFQCEICKLGFNRKDNLRRHLETCRLKMNSIQQYQCDICKRCFFRKDNFKRHLDKCLLMKNYICQSGNELKCAECLDFFKKPYSVFKYLTRVPDTEIDHEHLELASMNEFYSWKENLEKTTVTSYRKGTVTKSEQYTVYKFKCHRSGTYVLKSHNRKRSEKLYGSKKVGICPADISVRLNNKTGSCKVLHTKTHLGHNISDKNEELRHIYVNKTIRDSLESKIALGIPHDRILDDSIESTNNYNVKKLSLLSGKDLQFITQSNSESKCSDQVCVEAFILLHSRSIIYHKKQHEFDNKYPLLTAEDIVIIIMTDSQKQFLQRYGEHVVMVDSIHALDKYKFLVHTLLVVDDDHEGIEVAFAITNRDDEMVASIFFDCIKNTVGCINTRILMTDMQENYYTSWRKVMGEPQFRLFCSWHVREAWSQNFIKIVNKEKRNSVRNRLYMISSCLDENVFLTELSEFLEDEDPDLKSFIQYFKMNYVKNVRAWAYCYRKGALINTNMKVEAFHSALKKFIRKQNIGGKIPLYICLEVLNKYLQLKNVSLFQKEIKGKIPYKLRLLRTNHYLLERNVYIVNVEGDISKGWNISLSSDDITQADVHFICLTGENCEECRLYCKKCEACIHRFYCSCSDHAVRFNMCIHIHALCIYLKANNSNLGCLSNSPKTEQSTDFLVESLEEILIDADETESIEEIILEEIEEPLVEEMKENILEKVNELCDKLETVSDVEWLLETIVAWDVKREN